MPAMATTTVKKIFKIIENIMAFWARGFLPIASIPLGMEREKVKNPSKKLTKITSPAAKKRIDVEN